MKFKNISQRPHWVGDVLIAPGATESVSEEWASYVTTDELQPVADGEAAAPKGKPGRKPKAAADDAAAEDQAAE